MKARIHIVTPEFPPTLGGVSHYIGQVAESVRETGQDIHVWYPENTSVQSLTGEWLHPLKGGFEPRSLHELTKRLDAFPAPRRLLVQWVPHGYGWRSMNLPFCLWVWARSRCGDRVEIMLHEAFLQFREGTWRQDAAAFVHRLMTVILLRAASVVWMSTPSWEPLWRPYAFGKPVQFIWSPIPSNIAPVALPSETAAVRGAYLNKGSHVIGHFGTYQLRITQLLDELLPMLADKDQSRVFALIGSGSERYRTEFLQRRPDLADRVYATGALDNRQLSAQIAACDLLVQPYPEGITARRTSAMASLAHGKAVVTTAGPMTEAFWFDNPPPAIIEEGMERVAGAVTRLLADRAHLTTLGRQALDFYESRCALPHVVKALLASNTRESLCTA